MENKKLYQSRRDMYRFLSRLYVLEVDQELLAALKQIKSPKECPNEDMAEGYEMMEGYWKENDGKVAQAVLDDLAVDYARIFLSAGVAQGKAAFPYESVYTSRKRLMMQDSRNEAVALYAAKGVAPVKDMYRVPEDHLGFLLEYMAVLCEECVNALEDGGNADEGCGDAGSGAGVLQISLKEQKAFLGDHLNNWVPAFAGEVLKYASTGFYKGLAKLTKGFLAAEGRLVSELEVEG